jgi:hypothetical protein
VDEDELRAFALARVEEAEAADRDRGLELRSRAWERSTIASGSLAVVRLIASPWADHPDYRPEWAPKLPD